MVRQVTEDDIGLKVLYPPDAQDAGPASSVDIVAIHGIGAHPDDTWCQKVDAEGVKERYVNWLSDVRMLPAVAPHARIMRYGYESQWFGNNTIRQKASTVAQNLLSDLEDMREKWPRRPLIFIAHCFGGLVILRAIVLAKQSSDEQFDIYRSTTGMIFLGTPFRGAGGLSQAGILQAIQSQYEEYQVQGSNLNILEQGNETLVDLMDDFSKTRKEKNIAHVACFFEQKPSNVGALYKGPELQRFVVDETLGCLDGSGSTEKYSLSRDHFNMNKFGKPELQDFKRICKVVNKMVKQAPALMEARNQTGDSFHVKFDLSGLPITGHFVDRDEMKEIEHDLLSMSVPNRRKVHILYGLGGIGKTELALAYTRKHQHQDTYSAILWLNGNSKDTLLQSLAAFKKRIPTSRPLEPLVDGTSTHAPDVEAEARAVLQWLALGGNDKWLVVIDNVDREDRECQSDDKDPLAYDVSSFFPTADHGSLLITTRLPSLGELGTPTKLGELSLEQALKLLCNCSGLVQSSEDTTYKSLKSAELTSSLGLHELATRLGYLPLALVQAGKYMRETGTSCPNYLRLYETSWLELLNKVPKLRDYANGSVPTIWMISYERIERANLSAAKFLQLWAYLDRQDIWYELFSVGRHKFHEYSWLQDLVQSEISFKEVMRVLLAYSLVESHERLESYSIHPVVHDWCAESISCGQVDIIVLASIIVGSAVPGNSVPEYWLIQRRLLPHADRCTRYLQKVDIQDGTECAESIDAFHNLGLLYQDQGKMAEAEKMYQRALDGYKKVLGPEHPSTLDTVNNLGILYADQGKMPEAEKMYQRALDGYKKALGPEHPSTLETIGNLGNLYADQGKIPEAERMYRRALDGFAKALGPEHPSTHETVGNLGLLYANQGKIPEAEKMYQRALDGYKKALGSEHTSTLRTVNNLGLLYADQGKIPEAERMYQRALDGYEKALGPEHTSTLDTVNNLGNLYANQGKIPEAEKMYQRALEGREKALGPEHPSTLRSVNNLGLLYANHGKMSEAEKMYQQALDGYKKALGPEHTSTLETVNNLGLLYAKQGKMPEAEKMYQRALRGKEKALGPEHTFTLSTVNNLGLLYANKGKIPEAEKMYQRALEGREKALGPEHPSTLRTVNNLGILYADQGKIPEAEKMYQQALDGYKKALGPEHTSTLETVNNLGLLYAKQGKMPEAEKMYQRALRGKEKVMGPEHPFTLDTVNIWGILYRNQGKMAEAEKMYQRALEGREKALGPEHPSTLDTVNNLGLLYANQGKMPEAEKMYQRALDGYKKAWGPEHPSTLRTVNNLRILYASQDKMGTEKASATKAFFTKLKVPWRRR